MTEIELRVKQKEMSTTSFINYVALLSEEDKKIAKKLIDEEVEKHKSREKITKYKRGKNSGRINN